MTAVGYPDISATSHNGRFTLEAKSPDNRSINNRNGSAPDEESFGYKYGQMQKGFRYQLIDTEASLIVWECWQNEGEPSPRGLFVSDDGWSVIHKDGHTTDHLIAVSPTGGIVSRIEVAPANSDCPNQLVQLDASNISYRHEHVHWSTAGLIWTMGSHQYFTVYDGCPCFVWLTGWGDRLAIRLDIGEIVKAEAEFLELCQLQENQDALRRLREAASSIVDYDGLPGSEAEDTQEESESWWHKWHDIGGMLAIAARNRIHESLPYLQGIACKRLRGGYTSCHALPDDHEVMEHAYRAMAKLAIRILGHLPEEYSCYLFFHYDFSQDEENGDAIELDLPDFITGRESLLSDLTQSMNSLHVLRLVGPPDYLKAFSVKGKRHHVWGEHWEYYHGVGSSMVSHRITWKEDSDGSVISELETVPMTTEWLEDRITTLTAFF